MKEISNYEQYAEGLILSLQSPNAQNLRYLFEELLTKTPTNFTDEELRNLIKITREIRTAIFNNIDTHILTIEHLADKLLCQRRARERTNYSPRLIKVAVVDNSKLLVKPAGKSKMEQLLELMNKATPEQLQQAILNAKKK